MILMITMKNVQNSDKEEDDNKECS